MPAPAPAPAVTVSFGTNSKEFIRKLPETEAHPFDEQCQFCKHPMAHKVRLTAMKTSPFSHALRWAHIEHRNTAKRTETGLATPMACDSPIHR